MLVRLLNFPPCNYCVKPHLWVFILVRSPRYVGREELGDALLRDEQTRRVIRELADNLYEGVTMCAKLMDDNLASICE